MKSRANRNLHGARHAGEKLEGVEIRERKDWGEVENEVEVRGFERAVDPDEPAG